MRFDFEFAARLNWLHRRRDGLAFESVLDVNVAFGIDIGVQDARLLLRGDIDRNDRPLSTHTGGAMFDQHSAFEQEDALARIDPGGDLVGIQRNGPGITGVGRAEGGTLGIGGILTAQYAIPGNDQSGGQRHHPEPERGIEQSCFGGLPRHGASP
jgi:hypothetical protein